jgi:PAS domain S-box-containing protein
VGHVVGSTLQIDEARQLALLDGSGVEAMSDNSHQTSDSADDRPKRTHKAAFEQANDAIFVVDIENDTIVDCNPAAEELVNYSRDELHSMPASDLHPHNLPEFMNFAERVFDRGHGRTDEVTCYRKGGGIIPSEMSASVVEMDGRPHLVNHIRELTDREERDWFEALIDQGRDLISVVKADGVIRYQSSSIAHELGYEPAAVRGEVFVEFVHPDDTDEVQAALDAMADRSSGYTRQIEFRFRHEDGSWAWLEGSVSFRPETPITGYVINTRDVTSRVESSQQAAVLNRILRHNLRNDLTVILGHAEVLADSDVDQVAESAETIIGKAEDLQETTVYTKDLTDILETSHISQQRHDIPAILKTVVPRLSKRYPDATIDVDVPAELSVRAAPKLDVAIEHVLDNALEHNDAESPTVEVTVRPSPADAEYVEIGVADNGPGIPDLERSVLVEGTESPLKHGSGLGLWLVNWIISRSGGHVTFDENEPRGSVVTLSVAASD